MRKYLGSGEPFSMTKYVRRFCSFSMLPKVLGIVFHAQQSLPEHVSQQVGPGLDGHHLRLTMKNRRDLVRKSKSCVGNTNGEIDVCENVMSQNDSAYFTHKLKEKRLLATRKIQNPPVSLDHFPFSSFFIHQIPAEICIPDAVATAPPRAVEAKNMPIPQLFSSWKNLSGSI